MLQDPQVLGNDHNKSHSLMSDHISTMYFHNMSCDLLNKILFKPSVDCNVGRQDRIGMLSDVTFALALHTGRILFTTLKVHAHSLSTKNNAHGGSIFQGFATAMFCNYN